MKCEINFVKFILNAHKTPLFFIFTVKKKKQREEKFSRQSNIFTNRVLSSKFRFDYFIPLSSSKISTSFNSVSFQGQRGKSKR